MTGIDVPIRIVEPRPDLLERISNFAQAIEPILLIGAGIWAFYLYRLSRRGEVRVGIEGSCRLLRGWQPSKAVLLVRLRIANTSSVLYRHREATATLFDARKEAASGSIRLVPFSRADPVPPVYGDIVFDAGEIEEGRSFKLGESDHVSLEPGEHFDSEVAFILDSEKLGLMALRVLLRGHQKRWHWWRLRDEPYWWGSFFFVDPASVAITESGRMRDRLQRYLGRRD
jgi:hypothetical protein